MNAGLERGLRGKSKEANNRKVSPRKMGEGGGEKCNTGKEEEVLEKLQKRGGGRVFRKNKKKGYKMKEQEICLFC